MSVPSLPIVSRHEIDRYSYPSFSKLDGTSKLLLITLAIFIVLLITWALIKNRMTVDGFFARAIWLLALLTSLAEQLSYLRLSTLFDTATALLLDADHARRTSPRSGGGGLSNPISTASRLWRGRQRSLGVNSRPPEDIV